MVLPDSHGISRAPCYSGARPGGHVISSTGVPPSVPGLSMPFDYDAAFSLLAGTAVPARAVPRPRARNACRLAHVHGLAMIRFRSPLLTEYLLLPVLRCFTSRRSLHAPYEFRYGSPHMTAAGFPHSDTLGSRFVCQLPEDYRRLRRPSSAPDAKASTLCPSKLDHKDHYKDARVHCAVLKQRTDPAPAGAHHDPHPTRPPHTSGRPTRPGAAPVHRRSHGPAAHPPTRPATRTSPAADPRSPSDSPRHTKTTTPRLFPQHPTVCPRPTTTTTPASHAPPPPKEDPARYQRGHQQRPTTVDVPPEAHHPTHERRRPGQTPPPDGERTHSSLERR